MVTERKGVAFSWLIIFLIIIYTILVGIRLAKIYINDYHLRGIIKQQSKFYGRDEVRFINRVINKAKEYNIPLERKNILIIDRARAEMTVRVVYSSELDGIFFKYPWKFDYQLKTRLY
ncbi:MAG: hypothetical protein ACE5WD_00070 [Candidatus Aminicenantia bacterium]